MEEERKEQETEEYEEVPNHTLTLRISSLCMLLHLVLLGGRNK